MPELPDWLRGVALLGQYGDEYVALATDEDGQLYVVAVGEDGDGFAHVLRTDDDGQLVMVPRGQNGNYLAVDSSGYLTIVAKGADVGANLLTLRTDDAGQLIMVPRGQDGNYLTVDASGFLTAVMKGDYEGDLVTVALDEEGRLSAFVIDSSDAWGAILKTGNAELAVRLGSPVIYDQRGRVQLIETFCRGLGRWGTNTSGAGASVALAPETWWHGGYSVALTGGSDTDRSASIFAKLSWPMSANLGLSVAFATSGNLDSVRVDLIVHDCAYEYIFGMIYDHANTDFESIDENGVGEKVNDAEAIVGTTKDWNHMKIVADMDAGCYIRAMFNNREFDISTYEFYKNEYVTSKPKVDVYITAYSRSGQNDVVYVDDVVLTTAEPTDGAPPP